MDGRAAYEIAASGGTDAGRFYGEVGDLSLGAGIIVYPAAYPTYSVENSEFLVVEGLVYILTHECDLASENVRPFNDHAVICPIIPIEAALIAYREAFGAEQAASFFDAIGKRMVERVVYLPPIADILPLGGLMYFGLLSNIHVSELERPTAVRAAAVTAYGLNIIDIAVENAFRRPKSESLSLV